MRVNWVSTYDPMLVDDRFQASAIPMPGTPDAHRGGRVNVIASPSRFNFDLRTPTGVGHMRAFIEGDFAGNGNTLRLRHAYGQWRRAIFGQTWSTFSDPEAEPDGIDFEGLNAIVLFRQPQIRWSFAPGERFRMAFALEDPKPDVTGATGVNQIPDFVARVRWEPRRGGHIQFSTLAAAAPRRGHRTPPTRSWRRARSASASAAACRFPSRGNATRCSFSTTAATGSAATSPTSGRSAGRMASSIRRRTRCVRWTCSPATAGSSTGGPTRLRSAFSFGIVGVSNLDIQPDDALHLTRRSTVNFMWSPIQRLDLVTEFLWGRRVNKNGQSGFAAQTQIGSTFRF